MAKGRTKNKRARPVERPFAAFNSRAALPPPTAYFTIAPGGENGYAFGIIEDFYYPWTPVYKFQVTILPVSSGILTWSPAGWTGNVREAHLPFITPAIEKAFTPAIYRFRININ